MDTWLLNNFPVWLLTVVTVGGFALLATVGCLLARRLFPGVVEGQHNELVGLLLGVFAAMYGVLLAFVIFILWDNRVQAEDTASAEATALSQIVFDAQAFPPADRDRILSAVGKYAHAVSTDEWQAMRDGDGAAPQATAALEQLRAAVAGFTPHDEAESSFYSGAVDSLEATATDRRDRLSIGGDAPLLLFEYLLVGGAILFVPLTYLFGHRSRLAHVSFVAISTALVALGLLLTVVLGEPFAGDIAVDPGPYQQGALAQVVDTGTPN